MEFALVQNIRSNKKIAERLLFLPVNHSPTERESKKEIKICNSKEVQRKAHRLNKIVIIPSYVAI